ncbi:hypothetical protein [Dactylosporangium darangshiense]|uniref:Uncharacterized protein n=1 Tax=Dactylosporangium darangshiense TaxID=579108 RepID=A0ABP8DM43_9ACTN
MNRDLYDQFADLAADMDGTDLHGLRQRVDRRSRRLRNRRAMATSAAVAVVAVLAGGLTVLQLRDQAAPVPVLGTSASPSLPPSPLPSSEAPSPATSASQVGMPPDALPGVLSYLTLQPGKPIVLHRYVDGTPQTTSFGTANDHDVYASPSPDGTRVVANTSPDPGSIVPGDLVVVAAGGARRILAHNVQFAGGSTAVWTPDGTAVIADGKRYDAATAATTSVGALPYLVFSPSGTLRAYGSPSVQDSIEITKADGSSPRTVSVAGLSECTAHAGCPTSVQSVSDDGRYLALGDVNSDPRHVYTTTLVYDTVTKQRVSLGQLSHAWFRADGAVVISGNQAKLYDKDWHLLRTYPLPAAETGDTRLHYRP